MSCTIRKLSEMTHEAALERLATAILREARPEFASLLHPGANSAGKTVKAPVIRIRKATERSQQHRPRGRS